MKLNFSKKILFLLFFATNLLGLNAQNCEFPSVYEELNINNVVASFPHGGGLWRGLDFQNNYIVPKPQNIEQAINAIYSADLWIGGIDTFGIVKFAGQKYHHGEYWPGPLNENGQIENDNCSKFNRFWKVNGETITEFRNAFAQNGNTLAASEIDESILKWPARNNPYFNDFELPQNQDLAPFWDFDNDGMYDATKGDYPVIDGSHSALYADQMLWWIFNDNGGNHNNTYAEALRMEIHALAYAFQTDNDLNNATFCKYDFVNKGYAPLNDTYVGLHVDVDLGAFDNDYIGSIPDANIGYTYNGTTQNGVTFDAQYGENPPIIGTQFLYPIKENGQEVGMSAFLQTNNGWGIHTNLSDFTNYYNYMQGNWAEGTPITYGGDGYINSFFDNSIEHPYMFSDEPSDANGWSECSENIAPYDRQYMMSCGPFNMEVGERKSLTIAVYWLRFDEISVCPAVSEVFEDVSSLADAHHQNLVATSNDNTFFDTKDKMFKVWPNPAADVLHINCKQSILESKNAFFRLFDVQGNIVFSKKINADENSFSIDITTFETGIYAYQFWGEKIDMEMGKILVLE